MKATVAALISAAIITPAVAQTATPEVDKRQANQEARIQQGAQSGSLTTLWDGALPRGYRTHLHSIRSYEKLTSEGMNFVGSDLLAVIETVLPSRFGGGPPDYQLVEEEVDGLPKVSVYVSPRLGDIDEAAVVETVPTTWSAADEEFFRIAGELFAPAMLAGAGVLLASYDEAVT